MENLDGLTWVSALWRRGCLGKLLAMALSALFAVSAVVVGTVVVFALWGEQGDTVAAVESGVVAGAMVTPAAVPAASIAGPVTLDERVRLALDHGVDRVVAEPLYVEKSIDVVNVRWALGDGFTNESIVKRAWMDVAHMLGAIHGSGVDYALVNFIGTLPLIDNFGNSSERPVFWVSFDRVTVEAINWTDTAWVAGVLYQRLPDMAASTKLHPALQGE